MVVLPRVGPASTPDDINNIFEKIEDEITRIWESIVRIGNEIRAKDENNLILMADIHDRLKKLEEKK